MPPCVQGLLVNDITWKMNSRITLPTHVEGVYGTPAGVGGRPAHHMTHPTLKRDCRLFVLGLKKAVPLV